MQDGKFGIKKTLCQIKYKVIISNNIIRARFFFSIGKTHINMDKRVLDVHLWRIFFQQFPNLFLDELSYIPGKLHTPKRRDLEYLVCN